MDANFYKEYDQEIGDKLLYLDSELHYQVTKSLTIGKTYDCIKRERTLTGYQYNVIDDRGQKQTYASWRFKNISKERDNKLKKLLNVY